MHGSELHEALADSFQSQALISTRRSRSEDYRGILRLPVVQVVHDGSVDRHWVLDSVSEIFFAYGCDLIEHS
jgi:hypothetical protein